MWIKAPEAFTSIIVKGKEYVLTGGYAEVPEDSRDAMELAGFTVVDGPPVPESKPRN